MLKGGTGSPRRKLLRITLIVFGVGVISAIGLLGVVWAMTPIPDSTQPRATAQGSVIFYRDGKTVLARQGVNRKSVTLDKVPQSLRNAVIAAENRSFYNDQGISLKGTFRAMWSTVTGQQLQGGSTITQQMVRNYYSGLSQERSIIRKLKEVMISLKVDQSKSKDWVLEQYLNTIYFGRGADGVQAAAGAYFRKDVSKLTLAESAYLAAVIQQPSRFADPQGADLHAARDRWRSVVDGMVATGAITSAEAAEVTFPTLRKPKAIFAPKGQEGYMLDQVAAELKSRGYTDEVINQGGLKIVSTFDKNLMAAAERAVTSVLPESTPKKVRTGLAAVDPATGEVLAFYGGRSYAANKFDNSFSAKVQAGSTFKAYTLAAALDNGFGLDTRVDGNSPLRIASADIPNSGGYSYGQVNLVKATQSSVNTAFVDLGQKVGLNKVVKVAESRGHPRRAARTAPGRGHAPARGGLGERRAERLGLRHLRRRGRPPRGPRDPLGHRRRREGREELHQGQARLQRAGRHRRHLRADPGRRGGHRLGRPPLRPPRGGQDRHHRRVGGRVVRRVHPAAGRRRSTCSATTTSR